LDRALRIRGREEREESPAAEEPAKSPVDGPEREIMHGGYDGFKWVTVKNDAKQVTQDTINVRIVPDPSNPKAAFVSEIKLTNP